MDLKNIKPERHQNGALSIHPYFGKLDPALARVLIEQYSNPGDIVLDPFCGSGTVLHEAMLSDRPVVGWDSSPLAVLIATAKLMGVENEEQKQLTELSRELRPYCGQLPLFSKKLPADRLIPDMPRIRNVEYWFQPYAFAELAYLNSLLQSRKSQLLPGSNVLVETAFSRIVIAASNQQGESTYRRVKKPDFPGRVLSLFIDSLANVSKAAHEYKKLMKQRRYVRARLVAIEDKNVLPLAASSSSLGATSV